MSAPSPGYSITVRAEAPAAIDTTGVIAAAVAAAGGALTALDVVESRSDHLVIDVTCNASDADHADRITAEIAAGASARTVMEYPGLGADMGGFPSWQFRIMEDCF